MRQAEYRPELNLRPLALTALSIVGAAFVAVGASFYRRPFATLRALRRARLLVAGVVERYALVRGVPIRYLEAGPRDGEPIVLVHGLGDSAESWSGVLPALACDHRVIVPDLAGFGRAPIPPEGMHFSVLTAYFTDFLAAIGVERAVLVGNSLGGAVAMRHAARHPGQVARLFLLNTAGLPIGDVAIFLPQNRDQARELVAVSVGAQRRLPLFILDDLIRRATEPARRAYLDSPERTDVDADLAHLTMPITIVWGERDRLIPLSVAERIREAQPTAELITLPNAGHIPQSDAPRQVATIIRERLR